MIVVDTTVWIDFLEARGTPFDHQRGLTIRRSVDCVIAATCLENDAELYHNDRDFDALARVSGLTIHQPA